MSPTVHILILAAGASSRMRGADKLVEPLGDQPLLRRVAETAIATGAPVLVTLPPDRPARHAALDGLTLTRIEVPDAAQGMSRSLVRGVATLTSAGPEDGVMILPGDMPGFTTAALSDLIDHFRAEPQLIWRGGGPGGQGGHPAIFPRALWQQLQGVSGDEGGRTVLQSHRDLVRLLPLPGQMALLDLDTPEDWVAFRADQT
jgi:molybdenum cofactor cytidylyltransferase